MRRQLNKGLRKVQEDKRSDTINKVKLAINELKSEGYEVSTKLLIERTGLSRSTFSKTHIIEILREQKVCRFKNTKSALDFESKDYLINLERKLRQLEVENIKLKKELELQVNKNFKLERQIAETQEQCATLRGQLLVLYQKASDRGVDLEL